MRRFFLLINIWLCITLISCTGVSNEDSKNASGENAASIDGHPAWIEQGNIYEVNVRQYTPEGTFMAFEKHLQRLKDMGVQTLWFMPIHPIGKTERKGTLGSYYAAADYRGVNPEFGTMQDWKNLVNNAHKMGFKVIIDWIPNHTAADHPWLTTHTDFYEKDKNGKPYYPFDWTDIRQLDFKNKEMQDSMRESMKFWVADTDIDGFRCDHVEKFQLEFWKRTIDELKKIKPVFMLAEAEGSWLYDVGFDMDYGWWLFHITVQIAAGKRNALSIDTVMKTMDTSYPANALKLYFTSNHDENSWNKADYLTMPGNVHAPFAVLTQTLNHAVPLIYSGQEEPLPDNLSFFEKDTIYFSKFQRQSFYNTLLHLRQNSPALAANASFKKVSVGDDKYVYAFVREAGGQKILVITNLSSNSQTITVSDQSLLGTPMNVFLGKPESLSSQPRQLEPWGYLVYQYK